MALIHPSIEFRPLADCPWLVYANAEDPDVIGKFHNGLDVRSFLFDHSRFSDGDTVIMRDADGNGSDVEIPIAWIDDGEWLHMSPRVLSRV